MKIFAFRLVSMFLMIATGVSGVMASELLDTSAPSKILGLGVRLGVNSSNLTNNLGDVYKNMNKGITEWGTGFETGIVVNLNLRRFLTIQPALLFQNKSMDYTVVCANTEHGSISNTFAHSRYYYFQVPVLASFRFSVGRSVSLLADMGPYFSFGLGGDTKYEHIETVVSEGGSTLKHVSYKRDFFTESNGEAISYRTFDWGFKFGVGVLFSNKYSFTIHYNAGCRNIANKEGFAVAPVARNKQWSFTLGYDF